MRKAPPEPDDGDDAELFRAAIGADSGKVRALPDASPPPAVPKSSALLSSLSGGPAVVAIEQMLM